MKEREQWLDNAKGFACFLVVYCHVVRGILNAKIVNSNIILDYLDYAIYLFHMPLFFMVSGYFYKKSGKIENIKEYFKFIGKKIINLGIPYIIFSVIFVILNSISSGTNSNYSLFDILNLYKTPIGHFWFLYDLIIIFILMPIFESIIKNDKILLVLLLIGKGLFTIYDISILGLTTFFNNGIYFYIGYFLIKNINELTSEKSKKILNVVLFIGLSFLMFLLAKKNILNDFILIIGILLAVLGSYIALSIIKKYDSKLLAILGKYSFQIYLMHTIFSAFIRIVLMKIKIDNFVVHLICGVSIGILMPIIISVISNKIVYTDLFIFPQKTYNQIKRRSNHEK